MPSSQIINELIAAKLPFHAYRDLIEPEKWGVEDQGDEFIIHPGMSKSSAEDVAETLNALRTMIDELQKANASYVDANTSLIKEKDSFIAEVKKEAQLATHMAQDCSDAEQRVNALAERETAILAALKPFADYAKVLDESYDTPYGPDLEIARAISSPFSTRTMVSITLGDCRTAQAAMSSARGEDHE